MRNRSLCRQLVATTDEELLELLDFVQKSPRYTLVPTPVPVSGTCVEHAFICRCSVALALLYCYSAVFCCLIKALHEPAVHWFKRCLIYWRGGSVRFNPSLIFNEEVHFYASSA